MSAPEPGRRGRTLFLDRDGVVNRQIIGDYVRTPAQFEFLPGALDALALLARTAAHIVVVTNQQGVGKGLMSVGALHDIHALMRSDVERAGGRIDDVLYCPHLVSDHCPCRKPAPGMPESWVAAHPDVAMSDCVVVGDSAGDLTMGRRLSSEVRCVAVGDRHMPEVDPPPDARFDSLLDYAENADRVPVGGRRT